MGLDSSHILFIKNFKCCKLSSNRLIESKTNYIISILHFLMGFWGFGWIYCERMGVYCLKTGCIFLLSWQWTYLIFLILAKLSILKNTEFQKVIVIGKSFRKYHRDRDRVLLDGCWTKGSWFEILCLYFQCCEIYLNKGLSRQCVTILLTDCFGPPSSLVLKKVTCCCDLNLSKNSMLNFCQQKLTIQSFQKL